MIAPTISDHIVTQGYADLEEQIRLEDVQDDMTGVQERLDSRLEPFVLTKEGRPIAILQNLEGYYHIHKALVMLKILS